MTLQQALAWLTGSVGIGVVTYALAEYLPFMKKIVNLLLKRLITIGLGVLICTGGFYLQILLKYLDPFTSVQHWLEIIFPIVTEAFGLATLIHGAIKQTSRRSLARIFANQPPED